MNRLCLGSLVVGLVLFTLNGMSVAETIEPRFVHLRSADAREWVEFPEQAEARMLELRFDAEKNDQEAALRLRQRDVKSQWRVSLNDKPLGNLVRDENDMVIYLPVPLGVLLEGENVLKIECTAKSSDASDDIRVGEVQLISQPMAMVLRAATVEIEVVDADSGQPIPARITIANEEDSLQTTSAESSDQLAVRSGVIYTATGSASFGLPSGRFTIYAGRGFEYSLTQVAVDLAAGDTVRHRLAIRREVDTRGYVACDTHIHTLTHSGHGDASLTERLITLAGEGIELPIATDHNVHIDYEQPATSLDIRKHFTPVIGCEFTTPVGHFNIFPIEPNTPVGNPRQTQWADIFNDIYATPGVKVAILNHGRDIHSGVRPLGPQLFNEAIGVNVADWPLRFNAMEIINSGATQSEPLQLTGDWMSLLNRGYQITPVGSSDSHDVSRYIVGQGRTYIRCPDDDAANIPVAKAIENFLAGHVMVSYGLLAELTIDDKFGPGDMATDLHDMVRVKLRVLAPHWIEASQVRLYANGQLVREIQIPQKTSDDLPLGVKWSSTLMLPKPTHDVHLVAVATGPGVTGPYWTAAKPYQPTSPAWEPNVFGVSGAVWLDGDDDGRRQAARDYAEQVFAASDGNLKTLIAALSKYDAAIAAQAAHLYRMGGGNLLADEVGATLNSSAPAVRTGFQQYTSAWRDNELAQPLRQQ